MFVELFGAALSSILLWASFFPGVGGLVWVALVPFFVCLLGERRRGRGASLGAAFGALFSLLEFLGLLGIRGAVGPGGAGLALSGMVVYGAVWGALFGTLAVRGNVPRLIGMWVLFEFLRASGPWGVAIGTVPLAAVGTPFVRAAAFGGPWLLSLAVAATNVSLAAAVRARKAMWLLAAAAGPLLLGVLSLLWHLPQPQGTERVALIQPGISLGERFREPVEAQLQRYREALASVPGDVDLVLLPEGVLPLFLREEPDVLAFFYGEAARLEAPMILGSWDRGNGRYYNTAFAIQRGKIEVAQRKVRLLPFGEYLPLRRLWERLGFGRIVGTLLPRDFSPGPGHFPFGHYGILICSESQFPGFTRKLAREGAQAFLVLTNDSWFGTSRILWEHFACGALRAAETGRVFLQAAITGITGGFGPDGSPLGTLPPGGNGALVCEIPLHSHRTPYVALGDGPALALASFLLFTGFLSPRMRRRSFRT